MTRGVRNNNPLNIRRVVGISWRGENPDGRDDDFCVFREVKWGLRAAFRIFRTYKIKYNARCIEDIITRWAPPKENDTQKYIFDVCKLTGFGGKERLKDGDYRALVKAMAQIESGWKLTEEEIMEGWELFLEDLR